MVGGLGGGFLEVLVVLGFRVLSPLNSQEAAKSEEDFELQTSREAQELLGV